MQARVDDAAKHWKFNPGDLAERKKWDDYQEAYTDAITKCNTEHAPWHIIPSDKKWYRNLVVSELLTETIMQMDPQYPKVADNLDGLVVD